MALTQAQRIEMSKKIVNIADENAGFEASAKSIEVEKVKILNLDLANKAILDPVTLLINEYQLERQLLDGNGHTQVTESDIQNAGNILLGNVFFPNDTSSPPPSLTSTNGVWTKTTPFLLGYAVGKSKLETYSVVTKEGDKSLAVNTALTNIQTTYTHIQRTTGQICTPGMPDVISTYTALHTDLSALVVLVNDWRSFLVSELSSISTLETDPTKIAQNIAATNDINSTIASIDIWLGYPDFDTAHGQTTCVGFNAYDPFLLNQTKLRNDSITFLSNLIVTRDAFIVTRLSQLNTNLGSVSQSLSTGLVTSSSGLYGRRAALLDLRLNLLVGSLPNYLGALRSEGANKDAKTSNTVAANTYASIMTASRFAAAANRTNFINLKSSAGFSTGQVAYIVSDTQPEIEVVVRSVVGNKVEVSKSIPPTYRESENARLYREV